MKFLIESRIQVLLEESTCKLKTLQSHLCCLSVSCSCDICPSCLHFHMNSQNDT